MTTRKEALIALRDKVRAENHTFGMFDILASEMDPHAGEHARQAYFGSLDAALALHEAVLPEWSPDICRIFLEEKWNVSLAHVVHDLIEGEYYDDIDCTVEATSDNAARAVLLAILEALIAEIEQ